MPNTATAPPTASPTASPTSQPRLGQALVDIIEPVQSRPDNEARVFTIRWDARTLGDTRFIGFLVRLVATYDNGANSLPAADFADANRRAVDLAVNEIQGSFLVETFRVQVTAFVLTGRLRPVRRVTDVVVGQVQ